MLKIEAIFARLRRDLAAADSAQRDAAINTAQLEVHALMLRQQRPGDLVKIRRGCDVKS